MARRFLLAFALALCVTPLVHAVITAPAELSAFLGDSDFILTAKIENLDLAKNTFVLTVQDDLKGKLEFRRLPTVIRPDADAVKLNHGPQLLKRLANDLPVVLFITREEKKLKANAFSNGTWFQLLGDQTDKDRAVLVLTHGEPYLRKMYRGTTAELIDVVKNVLAGKAKAPKLDKTVEPGFGPEAPGKSSRLPYAGGPLFAVIPTVGLLGPIAILAILFPTVFGGVLILFRQWTAFITMFSINSMLYLLSWWKGEAWLGDSWWNSELALWSAFTLTTVLCTIWAWRRQLRNLEQGADALDTPARTEFLVLGVLTATCLAFIAATWIFSRPPATDIIWNMTLVIAAGIVVGLCYKTYRGFFETMLPMATEGVMLGVASLASLVVFVFLARVQTGTAAPTNTVGANSGDAAGPQFKRERWRFESARKGLFASAPRVDENFVFAASSHPTFGYGFLYKLNLDRDPAEKGKVDDKRGEWKFGGGTYKRPISSPVISNGRVYIGEGWHGDAACKAYCIDAQNGEKVWEFQTANQTESTPAVEGERIYIGCGNDGYRCLKAGPNGTAEEVWRYPAKDYTGRLLRFASGSQVLGNKVYTTTGVDRDQTFDKGETAVFCFDRDTGKLLWKMPMPLPVWTTPVVNRGHLFVTTGNGDVFTDDPTPAGAVYSLNPDTGAVEWKTDLPNGVLEEPAVDKLRLYLGCRDGCCYAIDRSNGRILWQIRLDSPVIGTPATPGVSPSGNAAAVYAVSVNGRVVCLDPKSGRTFWSASLEDQGLIFITAPAVATRPVEGGVEHYILLGAGNHDADNPKNATLICLEDRTTTK